MGITTSYFLLIAIPFAMTILYLIHQYKEARLSDIQDRTFRNMAIMLTIVAVISVLPFRRYLITYLPFSGNQQVLNAGDPGRGRFVDKVEDTVPDFGRARSSGTTGLSYALKRFGPFAVITLILFVICVIICMAARSAILGQKRTMQAYVCQSVKESFPEVEVFNRASKAVLDPCLDTSWDPVSKIKDRKMMPMTRAYSPRVYPASRRRYSYALSKGAHRREMRHRRDRTPAYEVDRDFYDDTSFASELGEASSENYQPQKVIRLPSAFVFGRRHRESATPVRRKKERRKPHTFKVVRVPVREHVDEDPSRQRRNAKHFHKRRRRSRHRSYTSGDYRHRRYLSPERSDEEIYAIL